MNTDERIDRLLARTSRASDARPPGVCLDAETLAAWIDGSLTPAERTTAETHAADCDRCLAVLAAIARTAPPPAVSTRPAWLSFRWLVPLTTAAVAITAWAVVREPMVPPRPDTPAASMADAREAAETSKPVEPTTQADRDLSPDSFQDARRKSAESSQPAGTPLKEQARPSRSADPAAPAPAPESRRQRDEVQLLARAAQAPAEFASPDPDVRWRLAGTAVERSGDGGRTWEAQATGTNVELRAGSAPASGVCWIVGRGGTVLLLADGGTWRRLAFPDPAADLVAVTARDGTRATVTAADGRSYQTTDAGRTWTLQEDLPTPF